MRGPSTIGHYFADVEQPVAVADIMPCQQFQETRLYKEWVQPQGIVDNVSASLDKSVTSLALFGIGVTSYGGRVGFNYRID